MMRYIFALSLLSISLALSLDAYTVEADRLDPSDPPASKVFLPAILVPQPPGPIIHVPYFDAQEVNSHESAIFWFGQVRGNENYADVRVGTNSTEIMIKVAVIDRFLWYDQNPPIEDLTAWDAITVYLDLDGGTGNTLSANSYRFVGQLNWWGARDNYQSAYQGSSSGWNQVPLAFTTESGWRGNAPNDASQDNGYVIVFHIPFSSLGVSAQPVRGARWGAAVALHDRDDSGGATLSNKFWPQDLDPARPSTWRKISFGLLEYHPPQVTTTETFTIRHGLNGAQVPDGVVGGNTLCGSGLNFWTQWGDHTYPDVRDMNVQNQSDIADWPCFSKIYITFPLDSLPSGKVVVSAALTFHQSGQATGFPDEPPQALYSLLQVFLVDQAWSAATLTWNNAPQVYENVSQAWSGPITMADYGIARTWDVSRVVAGVYGTEQPLRLALYSADSYGPHGKYLLSSHVGIYEQHLIPSLEVVLGDS